MKQATVSGPISDEKTSENRHKLPNCETRDRLIAAVLAAWIRSPNGNASVRMIAETAKTSPSAIDYHFGSLEHLYVEAQRAALAQSGRWLAERIVQLVEIGSENIAPAQQASIIAGIIDDWTETQRPLAMAWRESHLARRNGGSDNSHAAWCTLWGDFWQEVASVLGLSQHHELLAAFHDGEASQHLMRWNRALDRALLDENTSALVSHLAGEFIPPSSIRNAYQIRAEGASPYSAEQETRSGDGLTLDRAAANIMCEDGIAAVTFRAVAKKAGTTLGQTSYHYGSKSKMLTRAFAMLYAERAGSREDIGDLPQAALRTALLSEITQGTNPILRAWDELIMHICRDDEHLALRGITRGWRDPAAQWIIERLATAPLTAPAALAAAFSSAIRGLNHRCLPLAEQEAKELADLALTSILQPHNPAGR